LILDGDNHLNIEGLKSLNPGAWEPPKIKENDKLDNFTSRRRSSGKRWFI
jgi:hypothetical protein